MPGMIMDIGIHDSAPGHPSHFMFAHHLTSESFQQSVREGCSVCNTFKDIDGSHSKSTMSGYHSLFKISFIQDKAFINIFMGNGCGALELCPFNGEFVALSHAGNLR